MNQPSAQTPPQPPTPSAQPPTPSAQHPAPPPQPNVTPPPQPNVTPPQQPIKSSRVPEDLLQWANILDPKIELNSRFLNFILKHHDLGGGETICIRIRSLLIQHRNGFSTNSFKAVIDKLSEEFVQRYSDLLLNLGLVNGLVFSVLYSTVLNPLLISSASSKYFSSSTVQCFSVLYYCFSYAALGCSIAGIIHSTRVYQQILVWMPTRGEVIKYLNTINIVRPITVTNYCFTFAVLSLPFGISIKTSPLSGLLCFLIFLCLAIYFGINGAFIDFTSLIIMHEFLRTVAIALP
jgi:hypothetical protein